MQSLLLADWILVALTAVMAVTGLFRGFSGTIAFIAASVASTAAGSMAWAYDYTDVVWIKALGALIIALLAFGLVRVIVRKCVNGLLAQPADSIFGFLSGLAFGALVALAWAYSCFYTEYSLIVSGISSYVNV